MKQRLFSRLRRPQALGEYEDKAVRHNVLGKFVRQSRKIWGPVPKEAQSVRL